MNLGAAKWCRIAELWSVVRASDGVDVDATLSRAARLLGELVDGSRVVLAVQRRVGPEAGPRGGFRPVHTCEFATSADEDVESMTRAQPADRRRLERGESGDRLSASLALGPDVEVSFYVERPDGGPAFDAADEQVLAAAIEGLRPLAARWVKRRGLMPGQRRLDELERRIVDHLLVGADEAAIASALELPPHKARECIDTVFDKVGVTSRIELMNMWMEKSGELVDSAAKSATEPAVDEAHTLAPQASGEGAFLVRAREAAHELLETEQLSLEAVAQDLGIGSRTLQRKLRAAGTSFRELADRVRHERAKLLLRRRALSLTDIALRLGYEQVSSFNRAVQRWAGQSPGELREQLIADDESV